MHCDDIHEYIVELLYDEGGKPPANVEMQDHLRTCPDCRRELEEMRQTRKYLQSWKDEAPLRSVAIAGQEFAAKRRRGWHYIRYAAIAAMACICILAAANSEIKLNKDGFSLRTHLLPQNTTGRDYYTKGETRDIVKRALDDSEYRMDEVSRVMMQNLLNTIDQERWMDLHLVRSRSVQSLNKN